MIMENITILGWEKKPKTLYRYLKDGDIFAYQIKEDLFGFGRILAKNRWGASAEFFDFFSPSPNAVFEKEIEQLETLFVVVLDVYTLFQKKLLQPEWRVIAHSKNFTNPYENQITSVSPTMCISHNPNFQIEQKITKEEAISILKEHPYKEEYPHGHSDILILLMWRHKEIFQIPPTGYLGYEQLIADMYPRYVRK